MFFGALRSGLTCAAAFLAFALSGAPVAAQGAPPVVNAGAQADLRLAQAASAPGPGRSIMLFAAASLTDVLGEIDRAFTAKTGIAVKASFASSSTLARQIEGGTRADVFFSADEAWMDYLARRNRLQARTRHDVVGNRLVIIARADSAATLDIRPGLSLAFSLAEALGARGRLATGDPDSVPVGRYAQAALVHLGVWDAIAPRLARAENVRAALAYVARGEAPLGIVYATDAQAERRVKVIGTFPADSHPPIRYPIAATAAATAGGAQFVEFVRGAQAREIFTKYGFEPLH